MKIPVTKTRFLLFTLILVYIWVFAGLAFDQHTGMRTHRSDLGQIDHAIWNSSQGRFLQSIRQDFQSTRMTDHVEPIFVLVSPVLWIWDDVRALLLLQVVAAGLGAWLVFELARQKFEQLLSARQRRQIWQIEPLRALTEPMALALAFAYLLAPQLQSAVLTEFHAIPLAVPLILWAFWAVENQRWGQFTLAALLVTGVKEEAALLGAGLGVWALWRIWVAGRRSSPTPAVDVSNPGQMPRRLRDFGLLAAISVTVLSLAWFYVATFVIVPSYALAAHRAAESTYFQRYGVLGNSPADIFKSFLTRPGLVWQIATEPVRISYVINLLKPFGFLSLLAPEILLLCLPVLLANSLSAYPAQYYGEFHYSAPLVPYVAVSALYGGARLWRWLARHTDRRSESFQHMPDASTWIMALVAFYQNSRSAIRPLLSTGLTLWVVVWSVIFYVEAGRGPLGGRYDPTPQTEHTRLLERFVALIPDDAAVTATAAVHPHVSHRRYIYQFPWGLDAAVPANWALLDVTTNTDMAPGDLKATVDEMLSGDWGVVGAADGFLLLRRGAANKIIPDAFYNFARLKPDQQGELNGLVNPGQASFAPDRTDVAVRASFGPLTFLGVALEDWPRWRQTKLTTLWQVEPDFVPGSVRPWLEVRSPNGELRYTFDDMSPPALVWYPPEKWQPGEIIRITTLWLYLPRYWGVAAGVVHGPDPFNAADRLPVSAGREEAIVDRTGTLALAAAYARRPGDRLSRLPLPLDDASLADAVRAIPLSVRPTSGRFRSPNGAIVDVNAWLPEAPIPAGDRVDLWLHWQGDLELLDQYTVFVHLRRDGENQDQNDGSPRYFVPLAADSGAALWDWRQLALPETPLPGQWTVVIGLFDPESGERLDVLDANEQPVGNELPVGEIRVGPPRIPDQACALIALACASQVK